MSSVRLFVATKAFVNYKGKILLIRESDKYKDGTNSGKYDVPGGRVKPGERFDESLLREIKEETGLTVKIGNPFYIGEWRPAVGGEKWQIVGTFIECFAKSSQVRLGEDHDKHEWIQTSNYKNYSLIDNLIPAFEAYLKGRLTFKGILLNH